MSKTHIQDGIRKNFSLVLGTFLLVVLSNCSQRDGVGPPTESLRAQSASFKRKAGADRRPEWENLKEAFALALEKNAGDKTQLKGLCDAWLGPSEPAALKKCEGIVVWPLSTQPIANDVVAYTLHAKDGFYLVVDFRDASKPSTGIAAIGEPPSEKTPHDFISEAEKNIAKEFNAEEVNLGGGSLDGRYKQGFCVVLEDASVTPENLLQLQKLSTLVALDLIGSTVNDSTMTYLSNHAYLASITLEKTSVTDAGLLSLQGVPTLKFLTIEGSRVTSKGVDALKKALPHCKVEYQ